MENRNISEIKSNPKNPRIIKDDRFKKLVKSLREFPEMLEKRPLVCFTDVDKKLVVLGGNMRLKAAQEIGLKTLPVSLNQNIIITIVFFIASFLRGFIIRRIFNAI